MLLLQYFGGRVSPRLFNRVYPDFNQLHTSLANLRRRVTRSNQDVHHPCHQRSSAYAHAVRRIVLIPSKCPWRTRHACLQDSWTSDERWAQLVFDE
jgi:hypothetical protein